MLHGLTQITRTGPFGSDTVLLKQIKTQLVWKKRQYPPWNLKRKPVPLIMKAEVFLLKHYWLSFNVTDAKIETKECYKCQLLMILISAVPHWNYREKTNTCTLGKKKKISRWRKVWTKSVFRHYARVFRRARRIDALLLFEHLQWQWITPVDPPWFYLYLTGCCRETSQHCRQPISSVTCCTLPRNFFWKFTPYC